MPTCKIGNAATGSVGVIVPHGEIGTLAMTATQEMHLAGRSSPRGVSLVWQVLASAAPKFQPVWDLLEEAVAVHVQFRAGLYPKGAGLHRNTTSRWTLTQGLGFTQGIWKLEQLFGFIRKDTKWGMHTGYQAGPVKGKPQGWMKIIIAGLYGKKGCFLCHGMGLESKRCRYSCLLCQANVTLATSF